MSMDPVAASVTAAARVSAVRAWEPVLDGLEVELSKTESLVAGGDTDALSGGSWSAPGGLPPLPSELQDRVQRLEARQRRVIEQLSQLLAERRRSIDVVSSSYGDVGAAHFYDESL
jgi:hypothetical protein